MCISLFKVFNILFRRKVDFSKKKSSTTPDYPISALLSPSGHLWEVKCKEKFRKIGHTTRFQSRDKAHSAVSDPNTINQAEKIENVPKENERTKSK